MKSYLVKANPQKYNVDAFLNSNERTTLWTICRDAKPEDVIYIAKCGKDAKIVATAKLLTIPKLQKDMDDPFWTAFGRESFLARGDMWRANIEITTRIDLPESELIKIPVLGKKLTWLHGQGTCSHLREEEEHAIKELIAYTAAQIERQKAANLSDEQLTLAVQNKPSLVTIREVTSQQFERDARVAEFAKRRAGGKCDLCNQYAPFLDKYAQPHLVTHHIIWLSRGGPDIITNAVALCPNCHAKMHVLDLQNDIAILKKKAAKTILTGAHEHHFLFLAE